MAKQKSRKVKKARSRVSQSPIALAVLFLLLPLLYSNVPQEPVVPIRWMLTGCFLLLFIPYFFLYKGQTNTLLRSDPLVTSYVPLSLVFLAWLGMSSFFSVNSSVAIQEFGRMTVPILLIWVVIASTSDKTFSTHLIFRAIAISAAIQGLVALLQGFQIEVMDIPSRGGKISGIMANGNLLGSAQVLALPFVFLATLDKNKIWAGLARASMVLVLFSIIIAASRSPWISLFFAVTPVLLLVLTRKTSYPHILTRWKTKSWFSALMVLALAALVMMANDKVNQSITSRLLPGIVAPTDAEASKIARQAQENITGRLDMWRLAAEKAKGAPLTGIGPGCWKVMSPLYEAEAGYSQKYGAKNLRPHNVYLQLANEYGIIGLILFILVALIPLIIALKRVADKKTSKEEALLMTAMSGGLMALAVDYMFSFTHERMAHMGYFALMVGLIIGMQRGKKNHPMLSSKLFWMAALLLVMFSLMIGLERWKFEKHYKIAEANLNAARNEQVLLEVEKGRSSLVKVGPIANTLEVQEAQAYKNLNQFEKAISSSHEGLKQLPHNFALNNNLGTIHFQNKQLDSAAKYFEKALFLAPGEPLVLKNLAGTYYNTKDFQKCIEAIDALPADERDERLERVYRSAVNELNSN
ncbi:MAG: O-antigen ligase family protein [Saprospiraceae bacterium]|nr:O-antigen ligase family protein [Saprospiraceae bacterium]